MTTDIRRPAEEDREQLVDLLRTSLNFTRAWADDRGATMPLASHRSVYDGDRNGSIEGFAAFRSAAADGGHLDVDFGLECLALATTTDRATRALLAYLRSFRGVGMWVQRCGRRKIP
jgi:hypothetical protein